MQFNFNLSTLAVILLSSSLAAAISEPHEVAPISERDDAALTVKRTTACGNKGQISRNKYDPKCLPSNSKGWKSAHNCQGKSYLCVLSGQATCYVCLSYFPFHHSANTKANIHQHRASARLKRPDLKVESAFYKKHMPDSAQPLFAYTHKSSPVLLVFQHPIPRTHGIRFVLRRYPPRIFPPR